MGTEMEMKDRLIEDYYYNLRIRKLAEKEGANETVREINCKLQMIKLKLQPLELPDEFPGE